MGFLKDNTRDPKRQFRFKVNGDGDWYWAKSIDKPTAEVSSTSYQLINHKFNQFGIVTGKLSFWITRIIFPESHSSLIR